MNLTFNNIGTWYGTMVIYVYRLSSTVDHMGATTMSPDKCINVKIKKRHVIWIFSYIVEIGPLHNSENAVSRKSPSS